jgi:hypothetical protein
MAQDSCQAPASKRRSLSLVGGGGDDGVQPGPGGCQDGGQDAGYRPEPTVEAEFGQEHQVVGQFGQVAVRGHDGDRDGEVERAAVLGQAGRVEADGDLGVRPATPGVDNRGPDPVPCLFLAGLRQAAQDGSGQPVGDVGLDVNQVPGGAGQRDGPGARGPR